MLKVKMKYTGEVRDVTPNEAHGLIDSGKATIYTEKMMKVDTSKTKRKPRKTRRRGSRYKTRKLSASRS